MRPTLRKKDLINQNLRNDYNNLEALVKYIAVFRQVSYYMGDVFKVSSDLPLLKQLANDKTLHGDALLALYRNQQNDQTLDENDLLLALEAETPLDFWKAQANRPDATLQDYYAFFTGPQGDSAYTVWKNSQPEGTSTTLYDYFQDIKGDPAENNTPDNILWDVGVPIRDTINQKADKIMQWIGLRSWSRFDIVEYQEQLYYAKNDIPAGSWNPALWQEIGSVTDIDHLATKTELSEGLAGKVTKETYEEQKVLEDAEDASIRTIAERADEKSILNDTTLQQLADTIQEIEDHPTDAATQAANKLARDANTAGREQNARDIIAEITNRENADSALSTRIQTAQTTANNKLNADEVDLRADDRIDASIASGAIKDLFDNREVHEDALVLEDFALDGQRLCGVSGADTTPSSSTQNDANLTLVCDGETPTEGTANLSGVVRFTSNSVFNGNARVWNGAKWVYITATQISGEATGVQEWRIDGVEWDFTITRPRTVRLDFSSFTPGVDDTLTFTFEGELTSQEGQAVGSIEEIAKRVSTNLTPSVLQTHSATIAQQHPMTAFEVTGENTPLSTTVFTVPTKDANNAELSAITDGELVKFEVPFLFDTDSHAGFDPECGLVIKADGIVVKTYSFENNNLLDPTQLNILTFYAGKGETLTFEPIVALSRFGADPIPVTVNPYFNLIRVLQLGILYNAGKELAESVVAVQTAKQRLIDNAQDAQIGVLGEGTQALRDEYETSVVRLEALETRLSNPGYAVLDRATLSEPTITTVSEAVRTALGDEWNATIEKGENPYMPVIVFDMTTGEVSPSSSSSLDFIYVRDSQVFVNVLTEGTNEVPAQTVAGTVKRGDTIVSADNPLQISLGQDGHHRQTSLTLTPDPAHLPANGAEFHVDFHAVVGENNRALYESNIIWSDTGSGTPVQKEATNENGESVTVNSFQQGNQVIIQINETGAESLPISGGYLSLYAHYDYVIPSVPAVPSIPTEVKIGDQVNGHFVVLLETGTATSSSLGNVRVHYGNGQFIDTNRSANFIEFYTNNDTNIGNIYSTDYRTDRIWDLTQLQSNAEAGDATLGFFSTTVTDHTNINMQLDVGLEVPNPDDANEPIDIGKEITELKKNSSGGGAKTGLRFEESNEEFEVDLADMVNGKITVPHSLIGTCYVPGGSIEALTDITYSGAVGVLMTIDNSNYRSPNFVITKTGDKTYGYYESAYSGLIDSATDIQIRLVSNTTGTTTTAGTATGRVKLTLLCEVLTG